MIFKNSCLKHEVLMWDRGEIVSCKTYTVVVRQLLIGINSHQDGSGVRLESNKYINIRAVLGGWEVRYIWV